MARHKQSQLEDVIEAVSRLQWWVGVGLAVVSYIVLSIYASIQVKPSGDLGSSVRQFRNRMRLKIVKESTKQNPLLDMSWQGGEELVGEYFHRRGYSVRHLGGNGPEGGIDLVATNGKDQYFIQCKQWRA